MINNKSWLYADLEIGVPEEIFPTKDMELLRCPLQHQDHGFCMFQTHEYQALQAQRLACELLTMEKLRGHHTR